MWKVLFGRIISDTVICSIYTVFGQPCTLPPLSDHVPLRAAAHACASWTHYSATSIPGASCCCCCCCPCRVQPLCLFCLYQLLQVRNACYWTKGSNARGEGTRQWRKRRCPSEKSGGGGRAGDNDLGEYIESQYGIGVLCRTQYYRGGGTTGLAKQKTTLRWCRLVCDLYADHCFVVVRNHFCVTKPLVQSNVNKRKLVPA